MFNRLKKVRKTIDLIIENLSLRELNSLARYTSRGTYTFKESLNSVFSGFKVRNDIETAKELIPAIIERYRFNPCLKEARRMRMEIEIQLFKPTLLFKIKLWARKRLMEEREKEYKSSYHHFLYQYPNR